MPRNSKLTIPATPRLPLFPSLDAARSAAKDCRACDLWKQATQTVFGEGVAHARVMLVGEQPGDKEDLAGQPFVGPAGAVLDKALSEAGIDRKTSVCYQCGQTLQVGTTRQAADPQEAQFSGDRCLSRVAGHRDRTGEAGSHRLSGGYGRTGTIGAHISRDATAWTAAAVRISSALARHGASVVDLTRA